METTQAPTEVRESVRALMAGSIDYAGLFPPSGLSMSEAVINYATYRNSNYNWMLGRFVLPVAQLPDLIENAQDFISRDGTAVWRLSVLAGEDLDKSIRTVNDFNAKYAPGVVIDSFEVRANSTSKIENTATQMPPGIDIFFEISPGENFDELISLIALRGAMAKMRTGGVTADAFPSSTEIVRFVRTCVAANVPFKATAGLHHPIRCFRPLTYESDADNGTMHGFLNLFLMTGFAREGYRANLLEEVMEEEFDEVFEFGPQSVKWRDYSLNVWQIEALRLKGIRSFGSCSFDEPVADLQGLGAL